MEFLQHPSSTWCNISSFIRFEKLVKKLKVGRNAAESRVKIMEEYGDIVKENSFKQNLIL